MAKEEVQKKTAYNNKGLNATQRSCETNPENVDKEEVKQINK